MADKTNDTKELFAEIHHKLAEYMLKKLQNGEAEAKDMAVMVKYLKDNDIELNTLANQSNDTAFNALVKEAMKNISTKDKHYKN